MCDLYRCECGHWWGPLSNDAGTCMECRRDKKPLTTEKAAGADVPLDRVVSKNVVDQDLVDKIRCLNGYLMMWRDDKKKPHELEDLIFEVDEWVTENSC